ncbi:MAG: hypothetical protein DRJ50_10910 [Actinobacteria bacterium]|nr:MAG: hypothetical protein DRJ50_10910 [Actinomycetota bacterium]
MAGAGTVGSSGDTAGRPVGFVFAQSSSEVGSYPSSAIAHFPTLLGSAPVGRRNRILSTMTHPFVNVGAEIGCC